MMEENKPIEQVVNSNQPKSKRELLLTRVIVVIACAITVLVIGLIVVLVVKNSDKKIGDTTKQENNEANDKDSDTSPYKNIEAPRTELVSLPEGVAEVTYKLEIPQSATVKNTQTQGLIITAENFSMNLSMDPESIGVVTETYRELGVINPELTATSIWRAKYISSEESTWFYFNKTVTTYSSEGDCFSDYPEFNSTKTYNCANTAMTLKYLTSISCEIVSDETKALEECDRIVETMEISYE